MGNVFVNLAVPAGVGVGAGSSVATMGPEKTVTVQGPFGGAVIIELSMDGSTWAQVETFTQPGKKIINFPASEIRVRRSGAVSGTPNVDVAANDNGASFATLVSPATDGVGAAVDVSTLGTFNAVTVLGAFSGAVVIEISEDNTDWAQCMVFTAQGIQAKNFTAQFMRVRKKGTTTAGTPVVQVGAADDAASGASSGGSFNYFGDGSDGAAVLVAPTTLTQDAYWTTLDTAGFDIDTAGFRIFVQGDAVVRAGSTIQNNGSNAVAGAGGAGGATGTLAGGGAGGAGGVGGGPGSAGASVTQAAHVSPTGGGAGGAGDAGGAAGGTATILTALETNPRSIPEAVQMVTHSAAGGAIAMTPGAGGGGGGGGTGGGGGGGGGAVMIAARNLRIEATGLISANGGDGAFGVAGNGGGGGGGSGGVISLVYQSFDDVAGTGLETDGGSPGLGVGAGAPGSIGGPGTVWRYNVGPAVPPPVT